MRIIIGKERLISGFKHYWDLLLISLFAILNLCVFLINGDGSNPLLYVPLLIVGCGYPASFFLVKSGFFTIKRFSVSSLISCSLTLIFIFSIKDLELTIVAISFIALVSSVLAIILRSSTQLDEAKKKYYYIANLFDWYLGIKAKQRFPWLISLTILLLLVTASWSILNSSPNTELYTEFYVVSLDNKVENLPLEIIANDNYTVKVGLANHEGRTVKYLVQMWLIESTLMNNTINVTKGYYYGSHEKTLPHINPSSTDDWTPQWEFRFQFNVSLGGVYKMFFILSKNLNPEFPSDLDVGQDYSSHELEVLVNQAYKREFQSLNMNLIVKEATNSTTPMVYPLTR